MAGVEKPEAQKSQDEARQPHCQTPHSGVGALLQKVLAGVLSYWVGVAICWQDFFNTAGSTSVRRQKTFEKQTGTGNVPEVTKDQISVAFIERLFIIRVSFKTQRKEHRMRVMGSNSMSAILYVKKRNHFTSFTCF